MRDFIKITLLSLLLGFFIVSVPRQTLVIAQDFFGDDFDWDDFFKDIESEINKSESDSDIAPAATTGRDQKEVVITPAPPLETTDANTLFERPPIQVVSRGGQKREVPVPQARKAAHHIMDEFTQQLSSLEKKIESLRRFTPEFRETFEAHYMRSISQIITLWHYMDSYDSYLNLWLAPPKGAQKITQDFSEQRKAVVALTKKLVDIDNKLADISEEKIDTQELERLVEKHEKKRSKRKALAIPKKRRGKVS